MNRSGDGPDKANDALMTGVRPLVIGLWTLWGLHLPFGAQAQILADPQAQGTRRPHVTQAANGVPLVNIQTPSAGGVSHNAFSQFDVHKQGAILNNAKTAAQTQLGGWVQGNPSLVGGSARVILNEVNSNNPSLLRGYVEVAGQRAQVVIANPSGITCEGCGFINAHRATLTTGSPVTNAGQLNGFRVQEGVIAIDGLGLDARNIDYTDLIARAVKLNASIWANQAKVITGANQVSVDPATGENTSTAPIEGKGPAPAFAMDVALLGGMYGNRITLVGTEQGLGVRNAGHIGAGAGEVIITADGWLQNINNASLSANQLHVQATQITNQGLIDGQETVVAASQINNQGTGRIYGDHLAIQANTLSNQAENGVAPVIAARQRLDLGVDNVDNREHALIFSAGDLRTGASLDANRQATGQASVLNNHSATLEALGSADLAARQINNTNANFSTTIYSLGTESRKEYQGSGSLYRYAPGSPGVYVFNDESAHLHTPQGNYESWLSYKYDRSSTETRVQNSDPAQILSGGAMRITADRVLNDKSHIIAGGAITASIGTLENLSVAGEHVDTDKGTVTSYWRERYTGLDATGIRTSAYNPPPTVLAQPLNVSVFQELSTPATTGTQTPRFTDNSLFKNPPDPSANYLIETDPRFVNYRQWLSSDYLLNALALNPSAIQKRLGDGFYEQKLISEQVMQLTGRRYLDNQLNDEKQYQALLDNAVTFAQAHTLSPGVSLSAAQMAQLTSDIVWLVEKEVRLPDGKTTKALVPQLYVRVRDGDLQTSGALIAADKLQLQLSADLSNSGTIAGRQVLKLSAENIHNLGGSLKGGQVDVQARTDLNNMGGDVQATESLGLTAGRDLNVISTTRTQSQGQDYRTHRDRVAGLYVTGPAGTLWATAGRDVHLDAALIQNNSPADTGKTAGRTEIIAGQNIELGNLAERSDTHMAWDKHNQRRDSSQTDIGTTIQTQGDILLRAGKDLNATAAHVTTEQGALQASAAANVNLLAGVAKISVDESHQHQGTSNNFSTTTTTTRDTLEQTTAQGSTFSGQTTQVQALQDINIKGSNVVSTQSTLLSAQNDIRIEAAKQTLKQSHFKDEEQSGIFGSGGLGFTLGTQKQSTDQRGTAISAAGSTLGSTQGSVTLSAGQHYQQNGSAVLAPAGDIQINAQKVYIVAARENSSDVSKTQFEQSGLTVALTSPVISAVQTAQRMSEAAGQTSDTRMKSLAAASVALSTKNAYDAVQAGPGKAGGVSLSLSLGSANSQSDSEQTRDSARESILSAGQHLSIKASGAGQNSDLTLEGARVHAGNSLSLNADDELKLQAARQSSQQHSTNDSNSASIGMSVGSSSGVTVAASLGDGQAEGKDVNWAHTHVQAGQQVFMRSGSDTTLKGAVVTAPQITTRVGGHLHIESLQDTSQYNSQQSSIGGSVTLGPGGVPTGGSLSASDGHITSQFASVTEQSGLKAADAGFDVKVAGQTRLIGGAITSTQKAVDDGVNHFTSGGALISSDLQNKSQYQAQSAGISLSISSAQAGPNGNDASSSIGGSAGFGADSGNAQSTTASAISGIAGHKAARTGDAETGLKPSFDPAKVSKEINAQVVITQEFGMQASKAIGDYADLQLQQALELRKQAAQETVPDLVQMLQLQADQLETDWGASGGMRVMAHTAVGGLTGGIQGAAGAATGTLTAPLLAEHLRQAGIDGTLAKTLTALTTTAAGGAWGGTAGAGAALNEVTNNYLKHDEIIKYVTALGQCNKAPGSPACSEVKRLEALDKQRDTDLISACQNAASTSCQYQQQQVRSAHAEIIRKSQQIMFVPSIFSNGDNDRLHTQNMAYSTLSQTNVALGTAQALGSGLIVEPIKALAQGFATLLQASTGSSEAQNKVIALSNNLAALLDPNTLVAVIRYATQAQREELATAYERGDAQAVGQVAGNILALLPMGPGAVGSIRKLDALVDASQAAAKVAAKVSVSATAIRTADGAANAVKGFQLQEELRALAKITPDTSRDAEYLAKTDQALLQKNNFDMGHVLSGEITRRGEATGYHAEFAAEGAARIRPDAKITQNLDGTYAAQVDVWDARKGQWIKKMTNHGESTFFPPSWSEARITYEVSEAFAVREMQTPTKWSGTTPSGLKIEGFINSNRVTFYPLGE